jgi:hypothetical protein
LVLGGLYLAVVAVTALVVDHPVRPLFEGVGPAAPYRWVNPPREFAAGNQPPTPLKTVLALGPAVALNTSDAQVVLNIAANVIPAHDPDTQLNVAIDPLDPATLGPLTAPLRADGNAYRVTLSYAPSTTPVGPLTTPGNIVLQIPEPADAIYFSPDGHAWQRLDSHVAGQVTLEGATFTQAGYYLAATSKAASTSSGGTNWPAYLALGATIALAALLGIGTQVRRQRRRTSRQRARSARRASAKNSRRR